MRESLDRYLPWVLFIITLALGWGIYREVVSRPQPGGPSIEATPAKELRAAPQKRVATVPVRSYSGTMTGLKLPADVQTNPNAAVIAAATIRPDPRPQTVTTVLDTTTGEARSYVKVDPYPWFAIEARGQASLAYGYKLKDALPAPVLRASVGYDVVRIKALTVGVTASADSDGDAFAGVGITYRW